MLKPIVCLSAALSLFFIDAAFHAPFGLANQGHTIAVKGNEVASTAPLVIKKCQDFAINGRGDNPAWQRTNWQEFIKIDEGGKNYVSRSKMLYSDKGIYLLFSGEDDKITTKEYNDFEEIYEGDVYEVFFHPSPGMPQYFEYEINQLNRQLILTLARVKKKTIAWSPWNHEYQEDPLVKRMVQVNGGKKAVGASINSWTAEIFFPNELFGLLPGAPPKSGTVWNANFCRIDYDSGKMLQWSWSKTIKSSFHELEHFQPIIFE